MLEALLPLLLLLYGLLLLMALGPGCGSIDKLLDSFTYPQKGHTEKPSIYSQLFSTISEQQQQMADDEQEAEGVVEVIFQKVYRR